MIKRLKWIRISAALLALTLLVSPLALSAGSGTGEAEYANTTELLEGYTYTNEISHNVQGNRVETFKLETTVGGKVYPMVAVNPSLYGGMTVTTAIANAEAQGKTVLAAVNADFFITSTKLPIGIVIEDGIYKSSPETERAVCFGENGAFVTDVVLAPMTLTTASGENVTVHHYNKARNDSGGLFLMSRDFSQSSTQTKTAGWGVTFTIAEGQMKLGTKLKLRVESVNPEGTNYKIGENQLVLTASKAAGLDADCARFQVGDEVTLTLTCTDERLYEARWATGCGDLIVAEGKQTDYADWDTALFSYHPRTVVGIKADGSTVLYVIDGRSTAYSNGARMTQMAADLIDMGCEYAVNLDGGDSTVLALKKPGNTQIQVVNRPSGGAPRTCASYILLVTDEAKTGEASRLFLKEDGQFLLAGSSMDLTFLAADAALQSAAVPPDVTATVSGLGTISGKTYTAGSKGGVESVYLVSEDTQIAGVGSLHILNEVDTLSVIDTLTGKAPFLSNLEPGADVQLKAGISHLGRAVKYNQNALVYAISPNIGTITQDGLLTVTGKPGEVGTVTVSAADTVRTLDISISMMFTDIKGHWAAEYIESLGHEGIVKGTPEGAFLPASGITRGDFVLMLYRAKGSPSVTAASTFTDVPSSAYYARAVAWAQQNRITQGEGDGKFHPEDTLTREQAFTLVYRAFLSTQGDADVTQIRRFTDYEDISAYAQVPAAAMISVGILDGANGLLLPKNEITRGEMAKILCVAIYQKK